jgi:uncharacterized membrane protein
MLERYNEIVPNGADRIVSMAESQVRHRQTLENSVISGNVKAQSRGQVFAFALGLLSIGGGIGLIAFGRDASGLVAIITALASYAVVFVYGKHEQRAERAEKRRELNGPSQ